MLQDFFLASAHVKNMWWHWSVHSWLPGTSPHLCTVLFWFSDGFSEIVDFAYGQEGFVCIDKWISNKITYWKYSFIPQFIHNPNSAFLAICNEYNCRILSQRLSKRKQDGTKYRYLIAVHKMIEQTNSRNIHILVLWNTWPLKDKKVLQISHLVGKGKYKKSLTI